MSLFEKLKKSLLESNHYKHLIGGLIVFMIGLILSCPQGALYATIISALSLDLKDKLYGNKFDWIDVAYTITIPFILYLTLLIVSLV